MADLVLILVLFLFIYIGYKNGFAKTLINASANVVSVVFGILLTNPVAKVIFASPLGTMIKNSAISSIGKNEKLAQSAVELASDGIAMVVSSVISFILVTLLVRIVIALIAGSVDIIAKLPLIKQANRTLGAIIGGISGIVICYVVIGFIFVLSESGAVDLGGVTDSIENSFICSIVYYNNIIGNALSSVL